MQGRILQLDQMPKAPGRFGPVARWRGLLGVIAVVNITLWALALIAVVRNEVLMSAAAAAACHWQLLLSAAYVFGCAYRSVLPVYDIPRIVLVDSPVSSVFVGRSVATIAELCFVAQWALALRSVAFLSHSLPGQVVSLCLVPMVAVAEVCSWHAVLTTRQLGHIFENSIWGLSAAAMVACLLIIGSHELAALYPPMIGWCVIGTVYAAYMFMSDVPMYWSRWRADRSALRSYLSLAQGVADTALRRVVSFQWSDWRSEVPWMTLYFSFGVWSSVSLIYAAIAFGAHHN